MIGAFKFAKLVTFILSVDASFDSFFPKEFWAVFLPSHQRLHSVETALPGVVKHSKEIFDSPELLL